MLKDLMMILKYKLYVYINEYKETRERERVGVFFLLGSSESQKTLKQQENAPSSRYVIINDIMLKKSKVKKWAGLLQVTRQH